MTDTKLSADGIWGSRWTFILAVTGSAIGFGNIWTFPYITGEYGGGAFLLVYILCLLVMSMPLIIAESLLGRSTRKDPGHAFAVLARSVKSSSAWRLVGCLAALSGFLILSFYSPFAGMAMYHVKAMSQGEFVDLDKADIGQAFGELLGSPETLVLWHSLFMIITVIIVSRGVIRGLGTAIWALMPTIFLLLILLMVFAYQTGKMNVAASYLLDADFSKLTIEAVLKAMGHAFFTLNLGVGAIMAYGAYMPQGASLIKSARTILLLDTVLALMIGLAIFPLLFDQGLKPSEGPGLLFVSLPYAFDQLLNGQVFGTMFFVFVTLVAWSTAIALLEPIVSWLVSSTRMPREMAAIILGGLCWVLGLGCIFSFNIWQDLKFSGFTILSGLDFLTATVLLPLVGLLTAIFVYWKLPKETLQSELALSDGFTWSLLMFIVKLLVPVAILVVFAYELFSRFCDSSCQSLVWAFI